MTVLLLIVIVILLFIISLLVIGIHQKNTNEICRLKKQLNGKTVVVTGGTVGMGLEMARDFTQRGARVIIASSSPTKGAFAIQEILCDSDNNNVVFKLLNLASFESIRNFAADILNTEDRLDILINNAGVIGPRKAVSRDGLNFVTQVNYYGAFLLTILLLPLLKKTGRPEDRSRIINVSSASYILGRPYLENTFWCTVTALSYLISKLYLVIFTRELAKRLKNSNVVVNNADPGAVGTNIFVTMDIPVVPSMVKLFFWVLFKHPWQGAQTAIYVALDKQAGEVSGEYFRNCQQIKTADIACDETFSIELWNKSVKLVKLTAKELEH